MGTLECMAVIVVMAMVVRVLLRIIGKAVSAVNGVFSVASSALHAIL